MDDLALLNAIAAGDPAASKELFERHAPWIAARLRRSLPAHAVEDVMQETFIAVWRGAGRYSGEGVVGAWIWGIARRQAAMWSRRNGRPALAFDEIAESAHPAHRSVDVEADAVRTTDLATALAALGPEGSEPRELVRLVYDEDRPLAEVAGVLGIPTGTVKSRLFKARQTLRAALTGEKGP